MKIYNAENKRNAQILRKGMTKEEKHLWHDFLRNLPVQFYRQKPIGKYIVDFYCPSARLIVELDGSQHFEDEQENYDRLRDAALCEMGFTVKRYTNLEIWHNFHGVCQDILNFIEGKE